MINKFVFLFIVIFLTNINALSQDSIEINQFIREFNEKKKLQLKQAETTEDNCDGCICGKIPYSEGECGTGCTFEFNHKDKLLKITADKMEDYQNVEDTPWFIQLKNI